MNSQQIIFILPARARHMGMVTLWCYLIPAGSCCARRCCALRAGLQCRQRLRRPLRCVQLEVRTEVLLLCRLLIKFCRDAGSTGSFERSHVVGDGALRSAAARGLQAWFNALQHCTQADTSSAKGNSKRFVKAVAVGCWLVQCTPRS